MAAVNCYYCDLISGPEPGYRPRPAEFDTGSEAPRCAWHWRFVCDHCGEPGHFMSRFYCPHTHRLLCREAGDVEAREGGFWAWEYWWELRCPDCGEMHPSLDYAEHSGVHPWQAEAGAAADRRWLSAEPHLFRYPAGRQPRIPIETLTDADIDASWSATADIWVAGYDDRGDTNRKYISDPVLFRFLGDVQGLAILDAGSGGGYLCRLLARLGARVVGVENSRRLHEIALEHQSREPLAIEYHHASISSMPFLDTDGFDAVVANYVLMDVRDYEGAMAEIARVLRPGGRFIAVVSHNTLDGRWYVPAFDSPRREDRQAWLDDDYFVRRAGYIQWGNLKPFIGFHRPLRDYVAAAKAVGLALRDLEEPEISEEGKRELSAAYYRVGQRVAFSYVLKFVKGGSEETRKRGSTD